MKAWREPDPEPDPEPDRAELELRPASWHCVECGETFDELERYVAHVHRREDPELGCALALLAAGALWIVSVVVAAMILAELFGVRFRAL